MTSDGLGAPRLSPAANTERLREALVKWREEVARLSVDPEINELGHAAMEAVRDKIDEIIALRASPAAITEGLREAFIAGAWWHLMGCHGALTHEKAHDEAKRRYSDAALRGEGK